MDLKGLWTDLTEKNLNTIEDTSLGLSVQGQHSKILFYYNTDCIKVLLEQLNDTIEDKKIVTHKVFEEIGTIPHVPHNIYLIDRKIRCMNFLESLSYGYNKQIAQYIFNQVMQSSGITHNIVTNKMTPEQFKVFAYCVYDCRLCGWTPRGKIFVPNNIRPTQRYQVSSHEKLEILEKIQDIQTKSGVDFEIRL